MDFFLQRLSVPFWSFLLVAGLFLAGCDESPPLTAEAPDRALDATSAHRNAPDNAPRAGVVYAMTNASDENEVVVYNRAANGRLSELRRVATGGSGGAGVTPSSNPLALDEANRHLIVTNAGSDDVSLFERRGRSLHLVDQASSGGPLPLSVTVRDDLVYVLNAGRTGELGSLSGFRITGGALKPLGTTSLPSGTNGPTQVGFTPDANWVVVTDRPSDTILLYPVAASGELGTPVINSSDPGSVTFGFDFTPAGTLLVSEARGAPGGSSLSHFLINADGSLTTVVNSAPTLQQAACWVEVTPDGRYAYVTNTASGTVTAFAVNSDGSLTRLAADGVSADLGAGSTPLDMTIAGSVLYVHAQGNGTVEGFRIDDASGTLTAIDGTGSGLPASSAGVASF